MQIITPYVSLYIHKETHRHLFVYTPVDKYNGNKFIFSMIGMLSVFYEYFDTIQEDYVLLKSVTKFKLKDYNGFN